MYKDITVTRFTINYTNWPSFFLNSRVKYYSCTIILITRLSIHFTIGKNFTTSTNRVFSALK